MSDTHAPEPRWIIRPPKERYTTFPDMYLVIDTRTDLCYGAYHRESAIRIAARLNGQEEE